MYADSRLGLVGQDSGARSQESGARSQESGARSQESGARSQESGARSPGSLTSTDTILEPVGTLLCGNVRLSLQKEVRNYHIKGTLKGGLKEPSRKG